MRGKLDTDETTDVMRTLTALRAYHYTVIRGLLQGKQDKEIAFASDLSTNTVHGYFNQIFAILGLHSRVELVIWCYAHPDMLELWPSKSTILTYPDCDVT